MSDLFRDIVPAILQTKKDVLDNEKDYNAFVVNKALSFHMDCILQANQMNMLPNLDGKLQFQYLLNSIRGYKRPYQKWHKRETMENLDAVKEYFNYSNEKAKEALSILSDAQIEQIKKEIDKGGLNVRNRRFDRGEAA
jgi:hypothetical protein